MLVPFDDRVGRIPRHALKPDSIKQDNATASSTTSPFYTVRSVTLLGRFRADVESTKHRRRHFEMTGGARVVRYAPSLRQNPLLVMRTEDILIQFRYTTISYALPLPRLGQFQVK
jgi:hypothetical protein